MNWSTFKYLSRRALKRVYFKRLFKKYCQGNETLRKDIRQNFLLYECKIGKPTDFNMFDHLLFHYPGFAYVFRYRSKINTRLYKKVVGVETYASKIFGSTKIGGGLVCFHPFASVLNAKSIGENFTFRNGLTIGNKGDDSRDQLAIIGDNVEVGANVCIIGGITIGNNVTIGSGAVVVKDVPDNAIVAGNPARVLRIKDI